MAAGTLLLVLICGTAASLSSTQWTEDRYRHSRPRPPPVTSFLETLKNLHTLKSGGEPRHVAVALKPQESPLLYVQTEDAGDIFGSHRRPVPRRREKRYVSPSIAMRGCHLGTCQTQNLANMLYRLGHNNGKEGSNKNTRDPQGYGRRRRSLPHRPAPLRTAWAQRMLDT